MHPLTRVQTAEAAIASAMNYFQPCARTGVNVFDSQACAEDLRRIDGVAIARVDSDPVEKLTAAFYRIVTRPVQMGCKKLRRIGRSDRNEE